jgi:hypothetical protein
LEAGTVVKRPPKPQDARRGAQSATRHSKYDEALTKAKRENRPVDIVLAADFAAPDGMIFDADKTISAMVCWVDTYAVEFEIGVLGKRVWINKAFLAGVWV